MKRIIYTLLLAVLCSAVYGCYEDKGNYDYRTIPESSISNLPEQHTAYRFNMLRLSPEIVTENGEDTFTYSWSLYDNNTLLYEISTERELAYEVNEKSGNYNLFFKVVSDKTDVPLLGKVSLDIRTINTEGVYVLKETAGGKAEIDLHLKNGRVQENYLAGNLFTSMEGKPLDIMEHPGYSDLMVLTEKDFFRINHRDAELFRTTDEMFFNVPEQKEFQSYYNDGESEGLINNGILYRIYTRSSNSGRFGDPLRAPDKTMNYKLFPKAIAQPHGTLFDMKSRSFWRASNNSSNFTPMVTYGEFPLTNMEYDLVFWGWGAFFDRIIYALMKHVTTGEYILLTLHSTSQVSDTESFKEYVGVSSDSGLANATLRVTHGRFPILYYVKDNKVMRCRLTGEQETLVYTPPSGETITHIEEVPSPASLTIYSHKGERYYIRRFDTYYKGNGDLGEQKLSLEGNGRAVALY